MLKVAVLKETAENEHRVSLVPESIKRLAKQDVEVLVQRGAFAYTGFTDAQYTAAGATIIPDYNQLIQDGDIFLKVQCVCLQDGMMQIVDPFKENSVIIGFFNPFKNIHNVVSCNFYPPNRHKKSQNSENYIIIRHFSSMT